MAMVKLCSFAPGLDLAPIHACLEAEGLTYQLREDSGHTELWVDDLHLDAAASVLDGMVHRPSATNMSRRDLTGAFLHTWPISLITIALGIAGYLVVAWTPEWVSVFTFTELTFYLTHVESAGAAQTYGVDHQWWRLITPAFLHFGVWHVLFNSMALWELGRRLEFVLPRHVYGGILLLTGVVANLAQHMLPGSDLFGGLSGVVFGLFGVIAVLYRRTRSPVLNLPRGLYILALVSLVVLPLILPALSGKYVANGAHVGGLLAGLALGLLLPVGMVRRLPGETPPTYP
jgi:GlpG protein